MGSGNMRAQLSLLFTDKELYENFIVPSKNNRMLHSIILKCLTAYYYNADVRNQIEGVEVNNTDVDEEHVRTQQESINNIRDILTMQGFLSQELDNTMQDGIDDFTDVLDRVNKTAESYGAMSSSRNEYGAKSVKLLALTDKQNPETGQPEIEEVVLPSDFATTIKDMGEFMSMVKNSGLMEQLQKENDTSGTISEETDEEVIVTDTNDTSEEDSTDTVEVQEPKKPTLKRGRKPTKTEESVEEEPIEVAPPPESVATESVLGEASDALSELLESL